VTLDVVSNRSDAIGRKLRIDASELFGDIRGVKRSGD
jgi:hypothetical protein